MNKIGFLSSRGLGDIIIALPIAKYFADQGKEIYWPVCEEFFPSFEKTVPWVKWLPVPTDAAGQFFLEAPLRELSKHSIDPNATLYLYHYLNTQPQMTSPELFNILKFDQYKYAVARVPFINKWTLSSCIVRDLEREAEFKRSLNLPDRYNVVHLQGSSTTVDVSAVKEFLGNLDTHSVDPAVGSSGDLPIVEINAQTDSIFDWLTVIEGAENCVCIDSVFANLIDQLQIGLTPGHPKLFWLRRSAWDLTPVLGMPWRVIPTNLPITEPTRVDPAVEARKMKDRMDAAAKGDVKVNNPSGLTSHVPFKAAGKIPTNFMHALKK